MTPQFTNLIQKVASYLVEEGAKEVFLFGSAARDEMSAGSDVDIAVSGLAPSKFYAVSGQAEDILGVRLDLVDLDEKTPFIRALKSGGELKRVA